jgi:hypothetical protein
MIEMISERAGRGPPEEEKIVRVETAEGDDRKQPCEREDFTEIRANF